MLQLLVSLDFAFKSSVEAPMRLHHDNCSCRELLAMSGLNALFELYRGLRKFDLNELDMLSTTITATLCCHKLSAARSKSVAQHKHLCRHTVLYLAPT